MTTAITDAKFNDLKTKLRELFELDKADLDFGIYRIMAAKNREVTDFLDRQLREAVQQTLAEHGQGTTADLEKQIADARKAAEAAGFEPDESPKVKQLQAQLASAGSASAAVIEQDIYNHLLAFFSRYYDEGDFISKRRYKGDTYAIPYAGEEVTLHWANKDQYYIKSGEWHKDYRFRVGARGQGLGASGGKSVRFQLVEATQETNNNKERDDARRRYILAADRPVEVADGELTLRFEFRTPTEADKQRAADGKVAIFGGKYAAASGATKGDEREQFCADAEARALQALDALPQLQIANLKSQILTPAPTDTKPARTLLGKHLDTFTARNTFDYFIHKDLGGFLGRELDFYIKNEVVRLDDLEALPPDHLAKVQSKVKAIRTVAGRVIHFLAAIENFQKKLWLKKKFVLQTHWLVTLDRIPPSLRDTVAANAAQWREWEALGFKPDAAKQGLFNGAKWGTRGYLDASGGDKLVVDTRFFDDDFKADVLASEEVRRGSAAIESAITGVVCSSENFQAINALCRAYDSCVTSIYIDPPYNTDASAINYKNGYKSSSWISLMADRVAASAQLLVQRGVLVAAIDDEQQRELAFVLSSSLPGDLIATICVRSNPSGRPSQAGYSVSHEYLLFAGRSRSSSVGRLPPTSEQSARFNQVDEGGTFEWRNLRREGSNSDRSARRALFYPIYIHGDSIRVPRMKWDKASEQWADIEPCVADEVAVWPLNEDGDEKTWRWEWSTVQESIDSLAVRPDRSGRSYIYYKRRPHDEGVVSVSSWFDAKYSATEHGTAVIKSLFGGNQFSYPKSIFAVVDAIYIAGAVVRDAIVVDYFAGSGTTGHAVINLNREDGGDRKFILVEMGAYFHTVLKPRIAKVLYSPDWKDGLAQTHGQGMSALVKYFALESYEDALNNLPAPSSTADLLPGSDEATQRAMLAYSLDLELGPKLLNLDAFADPWGYTINAQPAGEDEIRPHKVDLVETFNYLLGLKVKAYGPMERYDAEFERAKHEEGMGRLRVKGKLKRNKAGDGAYVFQRVEGELNDGQDTRVLVVWRKLTAPGSAPAPGGAPGNDTEAAEKDAAVLDAWMAKHAEVTTERVEHRQYQRIYINGPVTLQQESQDKRNVLPIEQTFKDRMFEDTGEGDGGRLG